MLIDREKLLKDLGAVRLEDETDPKAAVRRIVLEQETATTDGWVPVRERTPDTHPVTEYTELEGMEESELVIVYARHRKEKPTYAVGTYCVYKKTGESFWCGILDDMYNLQDCEVLAWHKLPVLYIAPEGRI